MKNVILFFLLALILSFIEKASAKKQDQQESTWSQVLHSTPQGVANPMITRAIEIALRAKPYNLIVLDLGAGTGRNIIDLLEKGAIVYAYDADSESIKILDERFQSFLKNKKLYVHQEYFEDITSFPAAGMIIAWRSLPFMEKDKFPAFWEQIQSALAPDGIFTGTFFGEQHMTQRPLDRPKLFRLTREEVLNLFKNFLIIDFQEEIEYDDEASKDWCSDQFEHIYRVIAKKRERIN